MKPELMDILVCPVCKGGLTLTVTREEDRDVVEGSIHCGACDETYAIEDSIPNLLPPDWRS